MRISFCTNTFIRHKGRPAHLLTALSHTPKIAGHKALVVQIAAVTAGDAEGEFALFGIDLVLKKSNVWNHCVKHCPMRLCVYSFASNIF